MTEPGSDTTDRRVSSREHGRDAPGRARNGVVRRLRNGALRILGRPEEPSDEPRTDRVALVLSGGGLRGLVHVGAWRALVELGIKPDLIVGTSIGGLIGSLVAAGLSADSLEESGRAVDRKDIAALDRRVLWLNGIRRPSLFRGDVLRGYLEGLLPVRRFADLQIPLQVNAVDLGTGRTEWFGGPGPEASDRAVSLVDAVLASCAVPTFYPPVQIGDGFFLDGGVLDTFALRRAAQLGATWIIGVDATADGQRDEVSDTVEQGMLAINERAFGVVAAARRRHVLENWSEPSLTLVQPEVAHIPAFDFGYNDYLIREGYRATRRTLDYLADLRVS